MRINTEYLPRETLGETMYHKHKPIVSNVQLHL
jgi:hypothetical protein